MRRILSLIIIGLLCLSVFSILAPQVKATDSPPVAYWKFDEGSGTVAVDSSGNGNTGTLKNGPVWVDGKVGKALKFDGIDDSVGVPSSSSLTVTGDQITVETWLKPAVELNAATPAFNLIDKGDEYGFQMNHDALHPTPDGKMWFFVMISGPPWEGIQTTTNQWIADTWYHLVGTYDGNYLKVYVNGELQNTRPLSGNLQAGGGFSFAIGSWCHQDAHFFNGVIDEVNIYNYARTAEEIWNDYMSVSRRAYLTDFIQLTTNPYRDRSPSWSPDSSKIAYFAFDSSDWYRHIWAMNPDGTGKTQLTFGNVIDEAPDYSPDGTKIVLMRYGLRGIDGSDLLMMNADGTNIQQLTSTGLHRGQPKWSHDGQRLAFYYGGAGTNVNEIHVMNVDGTNEVTLVSSSYPYMNVFWSLDDSKLVYSMDDGIWLVNTSPPYEKAHLFTTSIPTHEPIFSPDGEYILYGQGEISTPGNTIYHDLCLIDTNGNFVAQLTTDSTIDYIFDWSPDGQSIAFGSIRSGNTDIWRAKIVITPGNQPPSVPTVPQGPNIVFKGLSYGFTSSATDPDGDDVSITFNWGDGTETTVGPHGSGSTLLGAHSWSSTGMYEVKTKATDIPGAESDWSNPLDVTVITGTLNDKWAGYVVRSLTYPITSIQGTWKMSDLNAPSLSLQGTWVGIGGNGPRVPLLQAGIMAVKILPWDTLRLVPFWERVPGPIWFDLDSTHVVSSGDVMKATVAQSDMPGRWRISVEDITKRWIWSWDGIRLGPDQTTAEWIHEPGSANSGIAPFTPIAFSETRLTINNISYRMGNIDSNLGTGLYLLNAQRGATIYTQVSPITMYEHFTISYIGPGPVPSSTATISVLHSNANQNVYDSMGNHLGYNATSGLIDIQIPDSMYLEDEQGVQYAFLFDPGEYQIDLIGKGYGEFHLNTVVSLNDTVVLDRWVDGTTADGDVNRYMLSASATGTTEILPIAVVDINPCILNLGNKGTWITAYIELPKGFDVNNINVSSILLNNTIPIAQFAPTTIGDYDNDGAPDLMVKFNTATVISYIFANVNMAELIDKRSMTITLTITGKLNDGTPFKGTDIIQIIYTSPRYGRYTQ